MKFENKQEMARWLLDLFTNQAPRPKDKMVNGRWNVKEGDMNILIKKDSSYVYLSYVVSLSDDGNSYSEWYRGLGYIMQQVDRLERGVYDMDEFENHMLQTTTRMTFNRLFWDYYVFPFDKNTLKFFINWNMNPWEGK